jgi:hypothetical protein
VSRKKSIFAFSHRLAKEEEGRSEVQVAKGSLHQSMMEEKEENS